MDTTAPTPSLVERLKAQNTVEIPIPGETEKVVFRKVTLWDLAAADYVPVEIFQRNLTPKQAETLLLQHMKKILANPALAELEERGVGIILMRCCISLKIVASTKQPAPDEITVKQLGNLARYFFGKLMEASNATSESAEVTQAAPFRDEVRSDAGRGGAAIQRKTKRVAKK